MKKDTDTLEEILTLVCKSYNLTADEVVSPSRLKDRVEARQIAYALMRRVGYSYPGIGVFFNKDHTTILHGTRVAERKWAWRIDEIAKELKTREFKKVETMEEELTFNVPEPEALPLLSKEATLLQRQSNARRLKIGLNNYLAGNASL